MRPPKSHTNIDTERVGGQKKGGVLSFSKVYRVQFHHRIDTVIWKLCAPGELLDTFNTIIASMKPRMLMLNLDIMIPAMNIDERTTLLSGIKASAPPEAYKGVTDLAQRVLNPEDWTKLSRRIGDT